MSDTATPPLTIDLSTKVKGPDGKEVSIGDLFTLAAKVPSLETSLQAMQTAQQQAIARQRLLFNPSANMELRQKAVRDTLADLGHTKDEIDQYLAGIPNQAGGGNEGGANGHQTAEDEEEEVTELSLVREQLAETQRQLQQVQASQNTDRTRGLAGLLASKIKTAMANPEVQKLLTLAKDKGVVEQRIIKALDTEVRSGLNERLARGEKIIDMADSIFDAEIARGLPVTLAPFQSVIAGVESLGPTAETATGFEQILKQEPPKPNDPALEGNQLRDEIDKDFSQMLSQGAHELVLEDRKTQV